MKNVFNVSPWSVVLAGGIVAMVCTRASSSDFQSGELQVKSVQGAVVYSADHSVWAELKPGMVLGRGTVLRTGPDATADLDFEYSGTALRLRPGSSLELARMDEAVADGNIFIDTRLNLIAGSVAGSQRKLEKPSTFTIVTPKGSATIRGTEYVVNANGAVTCLRGEVAVTASSAQGHAVSAEVPAGFSFSPLTSQVAPTAKGEVTGFSQDLQTVRANGDKLGDGGDRHPGGNPECEVSPHRGHHHGHDHDHDHDDHHGDDHDGHDHGDNHGGGYGDNHY